MRGVNTNIWMGEIEAKNPQKAVGLDAHTKLWVMVRTDLSMKLYK